MSAFGWTPQPGQSVSVRESNSWGLQPGRYRIELADNKQGCWHLRGETVTGWTDCQAAHLRAAERSGWIVPIDPATEAKERQEVKLRAAAPLRGKRSGPMVAQHDASDLALFGHAAQPSLL